MVRQIMFTSYLYEVANDVCYQGSGQLKTSNYKNRIAHIRPLAPNPAYVRA